MSQRYFYFKRIIADVWIIHCRKTRVKQKDMLEAITGMQLSTDLDSD